MQFSKYLVVKKISNWKASTRITDKKPSLHPDEIAIYLTISVPDALFQRPALKADIKIDEKVVPSQISAEVIDNIQQVINEHIDMKIEISQVTQN
ncbi:MAG: hypothetical protein KF816_11590 [Melioribacteraceae bacterium]|nr:hypothetical protein [Melioribacteraceae bacterium]